MNWQATLDGVLAVVALVVGWQQPARSAPAMRMGCYLLASAAVLGTLRFSGLLPLPGLHQFLSMLGAGVAFPLLALGVSQPSSAVASQRRYTWIFAVAAAVVCTLVVMLFQLKIWTSVCAIVSAIAILASGVIGRQGRIASAGLLMVAAFGAFALKVHAGDLQPGDLLHLGLALGLILLGRHMGKSTARAPA
jgi:hypothetical protein